MTNKEIHEALVDPVCALEELCAMNEQSAMVNVISVALRKILDDIEKDVWKEYK